MKTISKNTSLFIGGFILMALAHLAIQCEDYVGLPEYGNDVIVLDNKGVTKAGTAVEEAFLSGDPDKVKELFSASSLSLYSESIDAASAENLEAFGDAFKKRELKALSEKYAEFKFTVNGQEYTIAMSMDDDENWKIMRL